MVFDGWRNDGGLPWRCRSGCFRVSIESPRQSMFDASGRRRHGKTRTGVVRHCRVKSYAPTSRIASQLLQAQTSYPTPGFHRLLVDVLSCKVCLKC